MKRAFILVVGLVLVLTVGFMAQAQQVKLSDGTYASTAVYLQGTWKWERAEPRQTVIMRFGSDSSFFFHNFTIDRQHWGRYSVASGKLSVVVTRTCDDKGQTCENRDPPLKVEYSIVPTTANLFTSQSERWERVK